MKVTHDMYGRAAKCVACHRKWFVPKENEIAEGTEVIQLAEHAELFRETGVFLRSQSGDCFAGEENACNLPASITMPHLGDGVSPQGQDPFPRFATPVRNRRCLEDVEVLLITVARNTYACGVHEEHPDLPSVLWIGF